MSKFSVSAEFNKKDLKDLSKDLDKMFTKIGTELASAPRMQPMVDKIRQGMSENSMKFQNHPIWEANKKAAKDAGVIDFESPLMMTGQLVQDFIFYAGKPKVSQIPYSDEFILGMFTWAAKERRRPTPMHLAAEIQRKKEGVRSDMIPADERYTYIKSNELIKMIMKSPRYPIMDSLLSLYSADIFLHSERLIDNVFSKRNSK